MKGYFIIYQNRALIRYDALFYFGLNLDTVHEILKTKDESCWDFVYQAYDNVQHRYIFIDTIPVNVREKFQIPEPEEILRNENRKEIDLDDCKNQQVASLKLFIAHEYKMYMLEEDEGNSTYFVGYIEKGFSQEQSKILSRTRGILLICLRLKKDYSIELIYEALLQLKDENKDNTKYFIAYDLKSLRTFYDHLSGNSNDDIDSIIIHGLTGKPGNRKSICDETEKLVVQLLQHFNQLSDKVVTNYANTIIKAHPDKYNHGKIISRQKVNQIKNGNHKNLIKAAIHGNQWIRDNFIPDVHRESTKFALDRVEIDFTKVHAAMVDDHEKKVKKFICRIKDDYSKAILGESSGRSESFDLFQIAFRKMLSKTGNRLPAELVYDKSPAFESAEFQRIKEFLNSLKVETTLTRNCQAKGGIESHFKTLLEVYMPQYVGSLGGNIASTKKHRPRHEILVLFEKKDYMEEEFEWEKILEKMNNVYNATQSSSKELSPILKYHHSEKPHSIQIEEKYVAYLSWHHAHRKFSQAEFLVPFDGMDYFFGWTPNEITGSNEKQKFVTERVGDTFDLYMNPVRPNSIHVFELGTLRYVMQFPLKERLYGNRIDQKIDPSRRVKLLEFLRQRSLMEKNLKKLISEISRDVEKTLGADLSTVIKEIQKEKNSSGKKGEVLDKILEIIQNRDVTKIDPFKSTSLQRPMKKAGPRTVFKPFKIRHNGNGKRPL